MKYAMNNNFEKRESVEYISTKGEIVAIILRKNFSKSGANFFTAPDDSFQFGVLQYNKGQDILAHKHIETERKINLVCEILFIQSGKVEVSFYSENGQYLESKIITEGDAIYFKKIGHGFKLLEDSKIIEVKQGPYLGKDKDKQYLDI